MYSRVSSQVMEGTKETFWGTSPTDLRYSSTVERVTGVPS